MKGLYILEGHEPVEVEELLAWAMWYETADRSVARDVILTASEPGEVTVSTVFLAVGCASVFGDAPRLFETIAFNGRRHLAHRRYQTWDEAEQGHAAIVREVMQATALGLPAGAA